MATLSIKNYTNHIFQAVSIRLAEDETLPKAVITANGRDFFNNPLVLFNAETRIGYYQGYTVIKEDDIISLCAGDRGILKTHGDIGVHGFYDTIESAEAEMSVLSELKQAQEEGAGIALTIPTNGYSLYHNTYGTSVTLGGAERVASCGVNCGVRWSEYWGFDEDYCYGYTQWEVSRNGFIYPLDETKMAIAIITEDDDLGSISQSEPYDYLLLWSPSKKAWTRPSKKYRKILTSLYSHIL